MTHRTELKLSPFVVLEVPTTCACCGKRIERDQHAVSIIRANPSRTGMACVMCWRKACACAGCRVEITPEVEHYLRWIPTANQFVAWCLTCTESGGLEQLRALS